MPARFEPIPRDDGVDDGLAARTHDPLWLLARQWQFGEFRGVDAGSISAVAVDVDTHRLDGWATDPSTGWQPYDPAGIPLERLVEQEPAYPAADPELRAQGGLRLLRSLARSGLDAADWVRRYAFVEPGDERASRGLTAITRQRICDGAQVAVGMGLLTAAATAASEMAALGLSASQLAAAQAVASEWLSWWSQRVGQEVPGAVPDRRPAAWDDTRLEYGFATRAAGLPDVQLTATEYPGGRLDWWAVDAVAGDGTASPPTALQLTGIPASANYGGMPASRFWEMEDAQIDLGSVDAAPHDLARLLMVGYATVYGNDWYVVPVRLPIGTLCRVDSFTVTSVFGDQEVLGPAGIDSPDFNLFGLSDPRQPSGASPWFLLASTLPGSLESAPVERVVVARDELANLAWAIEQRIEDDAGLPYDRYDKLSRPAAADPSAMPAYHVDTAVPEFWYPMAPEHIDPAREAVRLRLMPLARRVVSPTDGGADAPSMCLPMGVILAAARGAGSFWLHEEEVPRSGVDVARSHQRARWHDGSTHAWTTRRTGVGAGESSSGLKFDTVDHI
jgi:hypothetical protein